MTSRNYHERFEIEQGGLTRANVYTNEEWNSALEKYTIKTTNHANKILRAILLIQITHVLWYVERDSLKIMSAVRQNVYLFVCLLVKRSKDYKYSHFIVRTHSEGSCVDARVCMHAKLWLCYRRHQQKSSHDILFFYSIGQECVM